MFSLRLILILVPLMEQVDDTKEWKLPLIKSLALTNVASISMQAARRLNAQSINTNKQTFRVVEILNLQLLSLEWKECHQSKSWDRTIAIDIQGTALNMVGGSSLIELNIIAPLATQFSMERYKLLRVLNIECTLVNTVVMRNCRTVDKEGQEKVDLVMSLNANIGRNGVGYL